MPPPAQGPVRRRSPWRERAVGRPARWSVVGRPARPAANSGADSDHHRLCRGEVSQPGLRVGERGREVGTGDCVEGLRMGGVEPLQPRVEVGPRRPAPFRRSAHCGWRAAFRCIASGRGGAPSAHRQQRRQRQDTSGATEHAGKLQSAAPVSPAPDMIKAGLLLRQQHTGLDRPGVGSFSRGRRPAGRLPRPPGAAER